MADVICPQASRDLPTLRPNERRPSLYAATRLAHFVHHVKERLKRGIKRRNLPNDHVDLRQTDLQALALGDLDRYVNMQ